MQLHLDSYGAKLRVKDGLLEVRYAQDGVVRSQQFAAAQVDIIFLRKGTSVSADAVLLAMEHDVTLLITDGYGFPVGRFYPHTPNSTSLIQKAQVLTSVQPQGMEYVRAWIAEKMAQQEAFIKTQLRYRSKTDQERWQPKVEQITRLREKLLHTPAISNSFRGLEGSAGRIFYYMIGQLLPKRYTFIKRSRRPSRDAFNAFLNYAYALLYVRVEEALLEAGLNPYLGFMHRDGYQHKSLVFDFIEPFRMATLEVVYKLFSGKKVSSQHYRVESDESVWVNTPGKQLLIQQWKAVYEEKRVLRDQLRLTEAQYIKRRASQFAQGLLQQLELEAITEPTNGQANVHLDHVRYP